MTKWHCDVNCKLTRNGAGSWDDQHENFLTIKNVHRKCTGFQIGELKLKGKEFWGHTEIENIFTNVFEQNIDRWFDVIVAIEHELEENDSNQKQKESNL